MNQCMRALAALAVLAALAAPAAAQSFTLQGEAKSGVYWHEYQNPNEDPVADVTVFSRDDAGSYKEKAKAGTASEADAGRVRMDMHYNNGGGFGIKVRLNWESFGKVEGSGGPTWAYAFGYGDFFDDQLTVSVGKLGGSPWGTGGPEMWKEVELANSGGMRFEFKPTFIPYLSGLNIGFVLNYFNEPMDRGLTNIDVTLLSILQESVVGISYTHDLFHVRFAYRFDSDMDGVDFNPKGGDELVYRFEEYALKRLVPDLKMWGLGYYKCVSADDPTVTLLQNWLFAEYAPELFTAQIRFGLDVIPQRSILHVKPSFYANLFDKMLSVGTSFWFGQDYGDNRLNKDAPFLFIELEPKIQFNFADSYVAFAYNWRREYKSDSEGAYAALGVDPIKQIQWMNLRFCMRF